MLKPCDNCDMVDFCKDLGRCFFKDSDPRENEGEVEEPELIEQKQVAAPKKLKEEHREFLKDILNF